MAPKCDHGLKRRRLEAADEGDHAAPNTSAIATAMMRFDMPVEQIVKILRDTEPEKQLTRGACRNELTKFSRMETIYGKVSHEVPLELEDGSIYTAYVNNPFALLFAAASVSKRFSRFLQANIKQSNKIICYTDETVPGNNMRPEQARSYEALLWTMSDFPSWFRTRKHGWLKFGYILSHVRDRVRGGMPAIVKMMLHQFFPPNEVSTFSFNVSGMQIPTETGGKFHLKAESTVFFLDEKAAKVDCSVKGAAGVKPCMYCKNVVGASTRPAAADYLIHYTEPRRARFDLHTPETFAEMKTILENFKDSPELPELEIMTGLKYDPHGLLWDEHLASIVQLPYGWFVDAMHCWYSSGGIAQFETNQP
jgi:hypothetical protein